jgi:hypothetical protein
MYHYIENDYRNISIGIANFSEKDFLTEVYIDEQKVMTMYCSNKYLYSKVQCFSTSIGFHDVKINVDGKSNSYKILVLPMKYILVEYYGENENKLSGESLLIIFRSGLFPLFLQ